MYQKVILVGNLGRDPEMRYLPNGNPVTNFSIATNRSWKDANGETQKRTTWFRISVFGGQAEPCNEYLSKGRQVLVEGRLNADAETGNPKLFTKNDGSTSASFEIIAQTVQFLGSRGDYVAVGEDVEAVPSEDAETIPF